MIHTVSFFHGIITQNGAGERNPSSACLICRLSMDLFVLQDIPETLHGGVVVAMAFPAS